MIKSVNQSWAISEKLRNRYGKTWAEIDFIFNEKISAEKFREDPMATEIGILEVAGASIKMNYKDLIAYNKTFAEKSATYARAPKTEKFPVQIKSRTYDLTGHEITRLSETIADTLQSTVRAYELGLYL